MSAALHGENPTVLRRLDASFAVIGDVQFLPGYSVAISDTVGVDRLSDLSRAERLRFLGDMERLGAAVESVCAEFDPAFVRVNLEILGNADAFLHAHVWPRYEWEGDLVKRPVWLHPVASWSAPATALGPQHDALRAALSAQLDASS